MNSAPSMPVSGRSLPKAAVGARPVDVPRGFLGELRAHISAFIEARRGKRDFAGVLHGEVSLDITTDAEREQGRAARLAYSAEQSDREAARIIRETLADGQVTADEIPSLRTALRNIDRSAERDRQITEALA